MHCIPPATNVPAFFYVRENNTWIEECESDIMYILTRGKFTRGKSPLVTVNMMGQCNQKLYDTYDKHPGKETELNDIKNKMLRSEQSYTLTEMANHISRSKRLALKIPSEALPAPEVSNGLAILHTDPPPPPQSFP